MLPQPTPHKLLCLHGSGSNAAIFRFQCTRLANALQRRGVELVHLDAPIECAAGPGILPFFQGAGPFRKWHADEAAQARGGAHAAQMEALRQLLQTAVREQGPFAGVLGFSQGAKTAAALLRWADETGEAAGQLHFGVFVCATYPPEDLLFAQREEGKVHEAPSPPLLQRPTVHAIGESDPWRPYSEKMAASCDPAATTVIRFRGEHHMPPAGPDNSRLADLIWERCNAATAAAAAAADS